MTPTSASVAEGFDTADLHEESGTVSRRKNLIESAIYILVSLLIVSLLNK